MNIQTTLSAAIALPLVLASATQLPSRPNHSLQTTPESRFAIASENRYMAVHRDALDNPIYLVENVQKQDKQEENTESAYLAATQPRSQIQAVIQQATQPTMTPISQPSVAAAPAISSTEFDHLFEKYGTEYNVDKDVLKLIAKCESTFNTHAVNGSFSGLFQFMSSTWISNRKAMGLDDNPDLRYDPEEAIKTAAFKISRDGVGAWPVCGRKAMAIVHPQ